MANKIVLRVPKFPECENMKLTLSLIGLLIFGLFVVPLRVIADDQPPDWWKTQQEVGAILMEQKKDIARLAVEVRVSNPKTTQEAMFNLSVFMRAAMNKEAIGALNELKKLDPSLDNYQIELIYYDACDKLLDWDLAQAIVEVFADNISQVTLDNRLLKHFLESGRSIDDVDRWLKGRPKGKENFWVKERLRFNMEHGRGGNVDSGTCRYCSK